MEAKDEIISTMQDLLNELNKNYKNTEFTDYIEQTLKELQKDNGVAFTGIMQQFINKGPLVKMSSNIVLNDTEKQLWSKLRSFNQLGNNLWGAFL